MKTTPDRSAATPCDTLQETVFERCVSMVRCRSCKHEWVPRTDVAAGVLPKACPRCFSHFWNQPYVNRIVGAPAPSKARKPRVDKGRSRKRAS